MNECRGDIRPVYLCFALSDLYDRFAFGSVVEAALHVLVTLQNQFLAPNSLHRAHIHRPDGKTRVRYAMTMTFFDFYTELSSMENGVRIRA